MTSEHTPAAAEDAAPDSDRDARLIQLDKNKTGASPAKDINHKITSLDSDLAQLRSELAAINHSVEEGLDRLGDTDTDLTAKVSETYKRLGEIDNAYKSLLQISSRIDTDIKKLNGDVSVVARQTASGIKHLEQSTMAQGSEFARENQKIAGRLEQLVETSRLGSELLKEKIHYVTDRILQVEKNLLADIEALSAQSASESERLDNAVEANRARIIKLQSIDEAIIKRATTLEITSAELGVKSRQLETAVEQLQTSSNTLFAELKTLHARTDRLQAQSAAQAQQITELKSDSGSLRDTLTRLAEKTDRHFASLAGGLALVLLLSLLLYFYQQSQLEATQLALAARGEQLEAQLQDRQQASVAEVSADLDKLQKRLELATAGSRERLTAELAGLRDRLDSIEGRFNHENPFGQIGDDNIIHGEQWLLAQPAENYTVELARLDDRQALYALAARYNHYLDQRLSSYSARDNERQVYVLLAGNYPRSQQAVDAIDSLPASLQMTSPAVIKLHSVQAYIKRQAAVNTL